MKFTRLFITLSLLWCFSMPAQVSFTTFPESFRLFARDTDNFGRFKVEGLSFFSGKIHSLLLEQDSGKALEDFTVSVEAGKTFSIQHKIPARLSEFHLKVFMINTNSQEILVAEAKHLLAGDFYIVAGQSNAESAGDFDYSPYDSTYASAYIRALGANFNWATTLSANNTYNYSLADDCKFGKASCFYLACGSTAFSGIWPLKLQCRLAKETGIPNCFVNGAVGGSSISRNMASRIPSLPDSLRCGDPANTTSEILPYDRIFKKLYVNNAIAGVKGIFWYQGETDGNFTKDSAVLYPEKFRKLHASWKLDYPSLKKIFVLQLNVGCAGNYLHLIREYQRKFPEEFEDVVTMSTVGAPAEDRKGDICHYTQKGCERIADKLLPLVKNYIYGLRESDTDFLPANVEKIYYSKIDQICIEFDKNILSEQSQTYALPEIRTIELKDYFYKEDFFPLSVESLESRGNQIFLNLLPGQLLVRRLSYLPLSFSNIPSVYAGPWIRTADNPELGAYAFAEFPVSTELLQALVVYPNPAKDQLEVFVNGSSPDGLQMFDSEGNLVMSYKSKKKRYMLDISGLHKGIYFVKVLFGETYHTKKIVVE